MQTYQNSAARQLVLTRLTISIPVSCMRRSDGVAGFFRELIDWQLGSYSISSVHQALPLPAGPTGKSDQAKNKDNLYSPHMC